ncbi:hypothetical protein Csa_010380 [Cucumis sativus]|uniref:Uncharacterized protein n=1 Tax=Cucumis sativus TaxID=3659 RepID=A0A0A0LBE1_CUCSA|nr:hypothetical protein Csa_010380 [Cucumis sativus]
MRLAKLNISGSPKTNIWKWSTNACDGENAQRSNGWQNEDTMANEACRQRDMTEMCSTTHDNQMTWAEWVGRTTVKTKPFERRWLVSTMMGGG